MTDARARRRVVVCGEALIDLVLDGRSAGPGLAPLRPAVGGGPFNAAVTLGRLGSPVSFLSRVSRDHFGAELVAALESAGVDLALLQRDDAPTTLAVAAIGETGAAHYTFYVEGTADRRVVDPPDLPPDVGAVAFGTLSMALEPGASVYERLLHAQHAAGAMVFMDPNIRGAVIPDADAYRARFRTWLPSVDVLKSSDDDAAWLAEGPHGSGPADWLAAGVAAVVLTRGGDGISVMTPDGTIDVPAPVVTTVDTIGAGDTVVGALLHWFARHDALSVAAVRDLDPDAWRDAVEFAARAAAVTVSRAGADPPWAAELSSD